MNTPPTRPWLREMAPLLRLAVPIVAVQLGMRLTSTVDMMMLGHMPAASGDPEAAMAAAALGGAWSWVPTILAMGTLMVCDPLFSQAVGARDDGAISRNLQRGLVWALLLTVPVMGAVWFADRVMMWSGQPPHLVAGATSYARIVSLGAFPLLVYGVLRQALQAHSMVRALLWTILLANVFNAAANWVLIRGHLGFPALGLEGSAYATALSRWLMAALLLRSSWPMLGRHVRTFGDREVRGRALRLQPMLKMLVLGLPIGIGMGLELGAFAAATLSVGRFGASAAAGHQATLDLASTSYMIPMGLGAAVTVRVGHAIGAGDLAMARRVAGCGLALGSGVMVLFATLFLTLPTVFGQLYLDSTHGAAAIAVTAVLIPIAGVFQIVDGLQAVAAGILRGLGDTRSPMVVNILGFWALGLPFGLWLAYGRGHGPVGVWWGLVLGLFAVATALLALVRQRLLVARGRLWVEQ